MPNKVAYRLILSDDRILILLKEKFLDLGVTIDAEYVFVPTASGHHEYICPVKTGQTSVIYLGGIVKVLSN